LCDYQRVDLDERKRPVNLTLKEMISKESHWKKVWTFGLPIARRKLAAAQ
jgi:hypothetical protein